MKIKINKKSVLVSVIVALIATSVTSIFVKQTQITNDPGVVNSFAGAPVDYGFPLTARVMTKAGPVIFACDYTPCSSADMLHDQSVDQAKNDSFETRIVGLLANFAFYLVATSLLVFFGNYIKQKKHR
ncbi:MAG: hypothetical protein JWO35_415 [Candidatus Saccharibacteria bacterium]|nr:hypothetical protein [Candidatus Saccharibacteria bacterium]